LRFWEWLWWDWKDSAESFGLARPSTKHWLKIQTPLGGAILAQFFAKTKSGRYLVAPEKAVAAITALS
jgi:hypothetical protein